MKKNARVPILTGLRNNLRDFPPILLPILQKQMALSILPPLLETELKICSFTEIVIWF